MLVTRCQPELVVPARRSSGGIAWATATGPLRRARANFDRACRLIGRGDCEFVSRGRAPVSEPSLLAVWSTSGPIHDHRQRFGRHAWPSAFASSQSKRGASRQEPPTAPIDGFERRQAGGRVRTARQREASGEISGCVDEITGGAGYLACMVGWQDGGASKAGGEKKPVCSRLRSLRSDRYVSTARGIGRGHRIGLGDACPERDGCERRSPRAVKRAKLSRLDMIIVVRIAAAPTAAASQSDVKAVTDVLRRNPSVCSIRCLDRERSRRRASASARRR